MSEDTFKLNHEHVVASARVSGRLFDVTLNRVERGEPPRVLWASDVFQDGQWSNGGLCDEREGAIVAAVQSLAEHLYRALSEDAANG